MTRRVFNYGGGMHSPAALTQFIRDALAGEVANGMEVVTASGMNVTVKAGTSVVGHDPSYDINISGTETVDVGTASPSNPMNALIVAYVDRDVAGSTAVTDNTNDVFKLKAVSGAAAATPSDPTMSAIQAAIGAANPFIILARVRKRAGATSVVEGDITDLRKMITLRPGRISDSGILGKDVVSSDQIVDGSVQPRHIDWKNFVQSKRDDTTQPVASTIIQHGRAAVSAPGGFEAIGSVVFPKQFKAGTIPTVVCSFNGYTPPGEGWTDSPNSSWAGISVAAVGLTNTSFAPRVRRFDGATLGGVYYFSWIAIGAV